MKKLLRCTLTALGLLCVCTLQAQVAQVTTSAGTTSTYDTVSAAFSAASSGDTVTLLADSSTSSQITIASGTTLTLDLAGHVYYGDSSMGSNTMLYNNGTLTINDSSTGGTGRIYTQTGAVLRNYGTLTINGGTFGDSNSTQTDANASVTAASTIYNYGTATINGGSFTAVDRVTTGGTDNYAAVDSGDTTHQSASLTITGGTFYGCMNSVITAFYGTATISGGTFTQGLGENTTLPYFFLRAPDATMTISGGTFTRNVNNTNYTFFNTNSGTITVSGGTFENAYDNGDLMVSGGGGTVYLTGGTFNSNVVRDTQYATALVITGGTYANDVQTYCADGYVALTNSDSTYTVSNSYGASIASDGTTAYYATLQAAIDAASSGATVTLAKDVTEDITIASDDNLTLDLNGCTLTNSSTHTIINSGTLTITDISSDSTGTVDCITHSCAAIFNTASGTMTLSAGTYNRSKEASTSSSNDGGNSWYTLVNQGMMEINGSDVEVLQKGTGGYLSSLIENGYYTTSDNTTGNNPTLTIIDGTFTGGLNSIKNDEFGIIDISGGTFTNSAQYTILNWHKATISGGTFIANNGSVVINAKYNSNSIGDLDISGGTFTAASGYAAVVVSSQYPSTDISISGGTFSSDVSDYVVTGYYSSADSSGTTWTVDSYVISVNGTYYTSFAEALAATQTAYEAGTTDFTLQLLTDVDLGSTNVVFPSRTNVTLDLNGNTVTYSGSLYAVAIDDGSYASPVTTLTIEDSSTEQTGTISVSGSATACVSNSNGNLVIHGGRFVQKGTASDYSVYSTSSLTIDPADGQTVELTGGLHLTQGNSAYTVAITGGTFTGDDYYAVYVGQGTVDMNISGGTFTAGTAGNVIYIASDSSTVTVTGGTLTGGGLYVTSGSTVIAKGGTYSANVTDYVAEGYTITQDATTSLYTVVSQYAAKVVASDSTTATYYYATVQEAVNAASSEATVTLLKDTTEDVTVPSTASLTLDLNGYTLTNASAHTIINKGTLTITDSSSEHTGVVDSVIHTKAALFNDIGGVVTLNGGTFDRSAEASTSLSSDGGNSYYTLENHGTMTIDGEYVVVQQSGTGGFSSSLIDNGFAKTSDNTSNVEPVLYVVSGTLKGGRNTIENDEFGVLNITGGTLSNSAQCTLLNWNKATISGGTFTSDYDVIWNGTYTGDNTVGTLAISGGTFTAGTGSVVIGKHSAALTAGTTTITGGTFSNDVTDYCAEGYASVVNSDGTLWTVSQVLAMITSVDDTVTYYGATYTWAQIFQALKEGDTLTLLTDCEYYGNNTTAGKANADLMVLVYNVTIDLNGYNITNTNTSSSRYGLYVKPTSDPTIHTGLVDDFYPITIKNSQSAEGTSTIEASRPVYLQAKSATYPVVLKIEDGVALSSSYATTTQIIYLNNNSFVQCPSDKQPSDNPYKMPLNYFYFTKAGTSTQYFTNAFSPVSVSNAEDRTLTLLGDYSGTGISYYLGLTASGTLDLGNHTFTYGYSSTKYQYAALNVQVADADIVVRNGKICATGTNGIGAKVWGDGSNTTLTLENVDISSTSNYAIATNIPTMSNGSTSTVNASITLTGSTTVSTSATDKPAIYIPTTGTLTIGGTTTVSGPTGVQMTAGTLVVSDTASVTGTSGPAIDLAPTSSSTPVSATITGGTFTGATYALYESTNVSGGISSLAVSGGKFTGTMAPVSITNATAFITAGQFNADLDADDTTATYLADGYVSELVADSTTYYEVILKNYIASITDSTGMRKTYATVSDIIKDTSFGTELDVSFIDNLDLTDTTVVEGLVATTASATVTAPTAEGASAYERASLLGGTFKVASDHSAVVYDYDLGISAITVTDNTDGTSGQTVTFSVKLTETAENTPVASRTLSGEWAVLTVNGKTLATQADPTFTNGILTMSVDFDSLTDATSAVSVKITNVDPSTTSSSTTTSL